MKAALCKALDGPSALIITDVADPIPKADEAIVRVEAVGLNFADTLITRGKYQFKPQLPFSPGAEVAGVIERMPDGDARLVPGQRVLAYVNWGGAAEKVAVSADALVALPPGMSPVTAAGLTVTYGTAIHGLKDRGRVQPHETVVVTGAAGGAGQAAIEIAKLMGARVLAVASSEDKLAIAQQAGADAAVLFPGVDLKAAVRDATGGAGADVVYDCIGGEASEPLIRALNWQGRFLVVGFASGDIPKVPLNLLLLRGAEACGVFWGEFVRREPERHRANMTEVLGWVADGSLRPRLHATYPLEKIAEALGVLDRREATGKLVLTMS